ncbi:hypothetical protein SBOR_1113 [Sclerotinia borealis F-4128]|uniref:2EXR domain-containing protein n=1 Tax=Sclerotinia borealis (strain F-4128) TaxID=1432307 RepID=W9CRH2_SCLBF|nr:hypothetical protein SBOR_1113 [Sclerotinia borealis F-4128]
MSSTTTETTFHPFPRLSPQLRCKIWRASFPGPRLILVSIEEGNLVSNASLPISLQVCQESRYETLRFYKLRFAVDPSNARIYFNPECDAIQLLSPRPMDPNSLAAYSRLFSMASVAIKNDIKAVCMHVTWASETTIRVLRTDTGEAPFTSLFGPDCQVFLFTDKSQMLPFPQATWKPKRQTVTQSSDLGSGVKAIFGTTKFTSIVHAMTMKFGTASQGFRSLSKIGPHISMGLVVWSGSILKLPCRIEDCHECSAV